MRQLWLRESESAARRSLVSVDYPFVILFVL